VTMAKSTLLVLGSLLVLGAAIAFAGHGSDDEAAAHAAGTASSDRATSANAKAADDSGEAPKTAVATFAGGCFWCMQHPFDELDGVTKTIVGYTGGHQADPTYEEVSAGGTGHAESIEVIYDPSKIGYEKLLDVFWHNVDPTVRDRQFCDVGHQYRTAIFYHDEQQKELAEKSKEELEKSGVLPGPIVTEIVPASTFYPAEEYHQDYYLKNPLRYRFYRFSCGRDQRLEEIWGKSAPK
jgi:peptide-methionine (S)-S-oxide reductase